jgi:quinol monooxygenase YgiN
MPFMLKLQWNINEGREADFRTHQEALCAVMLEHPGVICYHADYPSERESRWVEIYASDEAFAAHLGDERGKEPLSTMVAACDSIICECWGDPNDASKEILAGFGTVYRTSGKNAFVLNPNA